VIAVTAAKQGYEDFLRYRADNMVNLSLVSVIRNGEDLEIKCEDIRAGDLVSVKCYSKKTEKIR
jgi:phospholipid-translocating ATPase